MLNKIHCLRKKKDFTRIYQQGRTYSSSILWMKVLPNHLDYNRIGVVVSKKTARQAVARNKIKRRFRSLLRERLPRLKPGYDFIITVRPEAFQQSYSKLAESLDGLLIKAQLL